MFHKAIFAKTPREKIIAAMRIDGFSPKVITDKAGFIYEPHQHPEIGYLVCLEGSMKVKVNAKEYDFEPGDKLIILGNTLHEALVGKNGCVFLWSEKI